MAALRAGPPPPVCRWEFTAGSSRQAGRPSLAPLCMMMMMIVYPRDTPPHTRTAPAQPPAAHHRRHSRPHHRRHGEHSPTTRQPHSNSLCSPPKEGPGPGSALSVKHSRPSPPVSSHPPCCIAAAFTAGSSQQAGQPVPVSPLYCSL